MSLWIVAVGCALALVLTTLGSPTEAAGYRLKRCIAPAMLTGAQTTWVCKASQKCCYDWLLRKGTCTDRCF
jgi:hypothetical protein